MGWVGMDWTRPLTGEATCGNKCSVIAAAIGWNMELLVRWKAVRKAERMHPAT